MRTALHVAAALLAMASAASLPAQTCVGSAPFTSGPVRADGTVGFSTGVNTYGLDVAAGKPVGAFGSVGISREELSDIDASARVVSLGAGYAIKAGPTSGVQVCPLAFFQALSGPNFDDGFDTFTASAHTVGVGVGIGDDLPVGPTVRFVPGLTAAWEHTSGSATIDGETTTGSNNYGELTFAAGIVWSNRLSIRPAVVVPVHLDGAPSTFQVSIGYNFGTARAH